MTSKNRPDSAQHDAKGGSSNAPPWANGLKQLYDEIVDEPLPDAFKDLLAQLDDSDDGAADSEGCEAT